MLLRDYNFHGGDPRLGFGTKESDMGFYGPRHVINQMINNCFSKLGESQTCFISLNDELFALGGDFEMEQICAEKNCPVPARNDSEEVLTHKM